MTSVGEVAWYVTGRFYAEGKALRDVGYFLHIQGIIPPIFDGEVSEANARFTFAASPFEAPSITNGDLTIGLDREGAFRIFLRDVGASFDDQHSFATGQCIATFSRVAIVPTTNIDGSFLANVFTAKLLSSEPFAFHGMRYDFRDLVGYGVTQWGTASAAMTDITIGVPFVGSAIRVGG